MKLEWCTSEPYPGSVRCLDAVLRNPPCGCDQHFTRTALLDWDFLNPIGYLQEHVHEHVIHHLKSLKVCPCPT